MVAGHDAATPLVLYDGVCGLCDRSVRWLLRRDARGLLRFAPLQGETAAALRAVYPSIPREISTVVYIREGRLHLRVKAFLYLAWHLRWPWRLAWWFRWLPGFLVDLPYRAVAPLRYRIFGKKEACTLPAPEQRERFLD